MRLSELEPRWVGLHGWSSPSTFLIGLTFWCPHCRTRRLGLFFRPSIDPDGLEQGFTGQLAQLLSDKSVWARTGDTFDTLTLSPSVDTAQHHGHWHGFIQNGEVSGG